MMMMMVLTVVESRGGVAAIIIICYVVSSRFWMSCADELEVGHLFLYAVRFAPRAQCHGTVQGTSAQCIDLVSSVRFSPATTTTALPSSLEKWFVTMNAL
jgi:hypothetical protein